MTTPYIKEVQDTYLEYLDGFRGKGYDWYNAVSLALGCTAKDYALTSSQVKAMLQ